MTPSSPPTGAPAPRPAAPDPALPARPPEPVTIVSDGIALAGRLFRPAGPARGALLVCHGAGSRKENHELMGEQAAAAGLAALTFDFRGHGESGGEMGPDGWRDAVAAGERLLAESGAPWLAARGASMGGCMLLLAARARPGFFRSLVLLCPADGGSLLAGLDELESDPASAPGGPQGREYSGRFDAAALRPFLADLDLVAAAARPAARAARARARRRRRALLAQRAAGGRARAALAVHPPRRRRPPRTGPLAVRRARDDRLGAGERRRLSAPQRRRRQATGGGFAAEPRARR